MVETRLSSGGTSLDPVNPFAELLSTRDLLRPTTAAVAAEETEAVDAGPPLPTTGNLDDWRTLADILEGMDEIDKGALGKLAAEHRIKKLELNDRLGLGLESKRIRKAWDAVLDRFAESGFLSRQDGLFVIAGREAEAALASEGPADDARDPAVQKLYDRYVLAMAERWDRATAREAGV